MYHVNEMSFIRNCLQTLALLLCTYFMRNACKLLEETIDWGYVMTLNLFESSKRDVEHNIRCEYM